jgi:predicted NACHT family NTPase
LVENLKRIVITGVPVSDFEKSLASYRQNLIHQLNEQHVIGEKRLSKVFVEQDFYDPPLSSQASGEESPRTNSFKMVEDHPWLFILSEPGMGKSTFLNELALRYARDAEKPLPILIQLRQELPSIMGIAEMIGINTTDDGVAFIKSMLQTGKVLLILDGLDEIDVQKNNEIQPFIRNFNPKHCLITCRLSQGSEDAAFESKEHIKHVQMAKFSRHQIERFADDWFLNASDANHFKNEIYSHNNLTELASQPLLLALLCSNFVKTQTIGQNRADIYKKAIETLLHEWDIDKKIARKSCFDQGGLRKKKAILSAIAYENFKANRYTMTKAALENQIEKQVEDQDGKDVLQEIAAHHGILIKQNNDNYTFLHLTFQEYFTALAIADNPNYQRELMRHIHEPRWREIFLFTASLLDNADDFFALFREALASDVKLHPALNWVKNKYPAIAGAESMPTRFFTLAFSVAYSITPVPTLIRDADPPRLRP